MGNTAEFGECMANCQKFPCCYFALYGEHVSFLGGTVCQFITYAVVHQLQGFVRNRCVLQSGRHEMEYITYLPVI